MTTKVVVRHFHEGNDANRGWRGIALYATVARVIDLTTGDTIMDDSWPCEVWSYCCKKDVPSRKHGREIAVGRLQKQFPKQCIDASFGVLEHLRVK